MQAQPDLASALAPFLGIVLIIALFFVAVLCVGIVVIRFLKTNRAAPSSAFPYVAVDSLLTPSEQRFFAALSQAVNGRYWIFPKVALDDVLEVRRGLGRSETQSALNKINRKHIDFVLCEPETYKVALLVELDDASHQRADRRERDRFVDEAVRAAGLPIVHVKAAGSYETEALSAQINEATNAPSA